MVVMLQYCPSMATSSQSGPLGRAAFTAGIDVGTTSVKAVVADEDGNIVERARLASALAMGAGGRFEHDAVATWWESPRLALRKVLAGQHVQAVAVSAMMPSVGPVDAAGRPLGPGLLYGDGRGSLRRPPATGDPATGDPATGDPATGAPAAGDSATGDPTGSYEMARLAGWAASQFPEACGYWPAQAVANASLAGPGVIDLASAFATGPLFGGSGWDEVVCRSAGLLPAQLPGVALFGQALGKVAGTDAVLGAGSVDGLCEQLVAGAVDDGDVLVALGSTLVVWLCVPGWPGEVPGLWRVPHFVAGKAMVGGASNAGGMWVDWVDRVLRPGGEVGVNGGGDLRAENVPLWWPWARGERVPWHDADLRIGLRGADLSQGPLCLRRAAFEASAFVVRHIVETASICGTKPGRFIVSGGGTANSAWLQALADVLGRPVVPVAVPETAALGAAFLARMAAGLESSIEDALRWARWRAPVEPRRNWAEAVARRYQLWSEELPRVRSS